MTKIWFLYVNNIILFFWFFLNLGADIRSVCTEAGMYAIRARRKTVTEKDFLDAVNKVIKGYQKFSATPKYMVYNWVNFVEGLMVGEEELIVNTWESFFFFCLDICLFRVKVASFILFSYCIVLLCNLKSYGFNLVKSRWTRSFIIVIVFINWEGGKTTASYFRSLLCFTFVKLVSRILVIWF